MSGTLIVIPTYNEKDNIEKLIRDILCYACDVQVLVVDDNSPDGTGAIADRIADKDNRVSVMHRMSQRGRGLSGIGAFKEAIKRKDISYVIEMDADFSHDPMYIPRFIEEIEKNGSDVVIGSRFIEGGSDVERGFIRRFFSRVANFFIRSYLELGVRDCSSGYRCFRKDVISSLNLDLFRFKGPAIIEWLLYMANRKGYRIKEIPIALKARRKGKTKLSFMKLSKVFMDVCFLKRIESKRDR